MYRRSHKDQRKTSTKNVTVLLISLPRNRELKNALGCLSLVTGLVALICSLN